MTGVDTEAVPAELELEALDTGLFTTDHEVVHLRRRRQGNRLIEREVLLQPTAEQSGDRLPVGLAEQVPARDANGALT